MKAPDSYLHYNSAIQSWISARDCPGTVRKIAAIKYLVEGEHWIRFRFIGELPDAWANKCIPNFLDYIEIVPLHIVSDPTKPEDRH